MQKTSPSGWRPRNVVAPGAIDGITSRAKLIRTDIGAKSAHAMSKLLEMSPNSWRAIETGLNLPSTETLLKLVERGYDPTWVLTGRGSMHLDAALLASSCGGNNESS